MRRADVDPSDDFGFGLMIDVLPTNLKQRLVMLTAQPEKKTEKAVEQPSASASGHRPQWGTDLSLCATGWAMAHCLEPSLGVKETGPGPYTSHHRATGRKVMDMEGYGRSLSRTFSLKLERTSRTTVRRHDTKSCILHRRRCVQPGVVEGAPLQRYQLSCR